MKSSHLFSFGFNSNLLFQDLTSIETEWIDHFNIRNYNGEWTGLTLRGPSENQTLVPARRQDECSNASLLYSLSAIQKTIAFFHCDMPSIRLLRLSAGSSIHEHVDPDLSYWNGLVRFHIPIITNDHVDFRVAGQRLNMKAGELWFADFSKTHSVRNEGETDRIHLVIDCEVNDWMRALFEKEGIIEPGETRPDPVDQYSRQTQLQMVQSLQEMGTETSLRLAAEMIKKYNLNI